MTDPRKPRAPQRLGHEFEEVVVDTQPLAVVLLSRSIRPFILILGAIAFVLLMRATPPPGLAPVAERALAVFAIAVMYWVTGALPLMVTSLLVIALLGVSGVMPPREAYALFGNEAIFFVLAAFMLAASVNHRGLGRRIALGVFAKFATTARSLVLCVYLLGALMSLVIPEHAVATMLFPIVLDVVARMELKPGRSRLATALFLAMAWGVNIGGIATLLGGARAPLALGILSETTGTTISFMQWSLATAPLVGLLLAVGYVVLRIYFPPDQNTLGASVQNLREQAASLGRVTLEERVLGIILIATILAWVVGSRTYGYAGIAIFAVVALFVFNLLSWHEVEEYVNWGIILMYGGAIALGSALNHTGAAAFLAHLTLGHMDSPALMIAVLSLVAIGLGEILSHSAVVAALVPVGLGLAHQFGLDARALTLVVAVPAGLTFVMPLGTPANALAHSSGYLRTRELLLPGAIMILSAWIGLNLVTRYYWPILGFAT